MSTHARRPWLSTYEALGKNWGALPDLPPLTLAGYVRRHAQEHARREALVFLGRGISYAELDLLADRCASLFTSLGARRGDVLALHLPNTPQYVVALVAAARLGLVTTSLSPLLTAPELVQQANDAGVKLLVTLEAFLRGPVAEAAPRMTALEAVLVSTPTELVPDAPRASPDGGQVGRAQVLGLSAALEQMTHTPPPPVAVALEEPLYLMYTGGTTGLPKGAQLSSRNLFMNCLQGDVFYGYRTAQEVVASAFPLFHIGGTALLLNALRTAATFLLLPDPRDLAHVCKELAARPPSVLAAVPALYQMLLATPQFRALDFSRLRTAVSGAAPFAEAEIERLAAVIGPGKFCEVYGMTETSPVQTMNPALRFKPGFVGIPLPGTEVRIVDAVTCAELPTGEVGEIIASGPQVMAGYLANPEATATALRTFDGRTWMFTGDVGLMDDEGYVKVCDRSKDMLIVGGYKVFSVEVETKLQALPFVAMCAVVGRPDPARPGNDVVQLFVQRRPDDQTPWSEREAEIIRFCRAQLAPYKVPREVIPVATLPLTSVGKIDKKALRGRARAEA